MNFPVQDHRKQDDEQKKIIQVYGALSASIVMTFIPSFLFAAISMILFTGVLIAAYAIRGKSKPESLTENHMTFIIRTIWISTLLLTVTTAVGGSYVWSNTVYEPMAPCIADLSDRAMSGSIPATAEAQLAIVQPCMDAFISANKMALIIAAIISGLPPLLYFVFRLSRGISRARSGYRLAEPKAWL